ncbi:MAG: type III pantothenate kinase [Alloprevotella sp.]|nr:type III pantothenate kinase [Alloprevotella sp.]
MQSNLTIDIGNTSLKAAVFKGDTLVETCRDGEEALGKLIARHRPQHCAISNVGEEPAALQSLLAHIPGKVLRVSGATPSPLRNAYAQPETLGADRWAAATGAWTLFGGRPLLIVDAGTCITYDFVSGDGTFCGGTIAPGIRMRLEAMHAMTHRLPAVTPTEGKTPERLYQQDTAHAMEAGARLGARMELEGYARHYAAAHPGLLVCLTGGDTISLEASEAWETRRVPDLVHTGLNALLRHATDART